MVRRYFREYSRELERDMEYLIFGEKGKLCFAFPSQDGRFFDFEDFGMVDAVRMWIDGGHIQLVCPDGIDRETWSDEKGDPKARIALHERWFRYITEELLPRTRLLGDTRRGRALVTGCSMGGVHAGTFFFRRPDLFDTLVSLSGLFDASHFFHEYMDDLVYQNSPIHFLRDMPEDHPNMKLYRENRIILCAGQGEWEEELLAGTKALEQLLKEREIPVWADYWGFDVSHDWCWWQKQLPYFFGKLSL